MNDKGKKRISVILPVYNVEPWISDCIDSLKKQALDGLEFIFVDDCGSDNSMHIVEAWAREDGRVRIIRNEHNIGSGPSRNAGIEVAQGEYLSFIDPDDWIQDDFYELLYSAATRDGVHDIAKGRCCKVCEETGIIGNPEVLQNERIRKKKSGRTPLYTLFTYEHWTAIYHRRLFQDKKARYGNSITNQDGTFLLRICYKTNDIILEDNALYYYVQREHSATNESLLVRTYGEIASLDERLDFIDNENISLGVNSYIISRTKTLLQRFQSALGSGAINRDDIFPLIRALSSVLTEHEKSLECCKADSQLKDLVSGNKLKTPALRDSNERNIRVSVIIPVFNPGNGIHKCINRLKGQLLDGLEFIFIDDCSTDNSMKVIEAWAVEDSRVRIFHNPDNIGAGLSRNLGIEEAKGEYLSFIDPDDYVSYDFYESLYAKAREGGKHDIAKGSLVFVDYESGELYPSHTNYNNRIKKHTRGTPLYASFRSEHVSAIYNHSLFTNHEVRYGNTRVGEDTTFLMRVCAVAKDIVLSEDAKYMYVQRPESATKLVSSNYFLNQLDSLDEQIHVLEIIYDQKNAVTFVQERCEYYLSRVYKALQTPDNTKVDLKDYCNRFRKIINNASCGREVILRSPPIRAFFEHGEVLPSASSINRISVSLAIRDWTSFIIQHPGDYLYYGEYVSKRIIPNCVKKKIRKLMSPMRSNHSYSSSLYAEKIPILTFHRIVSDACKKKHFKCNAWVEAISIFEKQMKYLYDNHYTIISLQEFEAWYDGKIELPKKTAVLTFDDGDYELYYLVYPILKRYQFKAVSFIVGSRVGEQTSAYVDGPERHMLGEDLISHLTKEYPLLEFQHHSYNLHYKTEDGQAAVFSKSYEEIDEDFSLNEHFRFSYIAYPYGKHTQDYINAAINNGMRMGFAFGHYAFATRDSNRYVLPRIKIDGKTTYKEFVKKLR